MSKRAASPSGPDAKSARVMEEEEEERRDEERREQMHAKEVDAWKEKQEEVTNAMNTTLTGMISEADVYGSYLSHCNKLSSLGYTFGEYEVNRSLFEEMHHQVFECIPIDHIARETLMQAKCLLQDVYHRSMPRRGRLVSRLVMDDIKYITPLSNMILLLTHTSATCEDLDLFWELTDRAWCFGHPIYDIDVRDFDDTCAKITKRLRAVSVLTDALTKNCTLTWR